MSSGTIESVVGGRPVGRIAPRYLPQTKPLGELLLFASAKFPAEDDITKHLLAMALVIPVAKHQRRACFRVGGGFADDLQVLLSFDPFLFEQHES